LAGLAGLVGLVGLAGLAGVAGLVAGLTDHYVATNAQTAFITHVAWLAWQKQVPQATTTTASTTTTTTTWPDHVFMPVVPSMPAIWARCAIYTKFVRVAPLRRPVWPRSACLAVRRVWLAGWCTSCLAGWPGRAIWLFRMV
jgi:hypothetical protein